MARQEKFFGKSVKRSEDPRLLRGDGRYVADIKLHGMVHAAVLRSPHGHARIVSIDTKACEADARTVAVLTAGDVSSIPALPAIDAEPTTKPFNQPVLASDKAQRGRNSCYCTICTKGAFHAPEPRNPARSQNSPHNPAAARTTRPRPRRRQERWP